MKQKYSILLALGIAVSSLSSCSRSNYAFQTKIADSPAEQVSRSASSSPADAYSATVVASAQEGSLRVEEIAPARQAATALVQHQPATAAHVVATPTTVASHSAAPQTKLDHATRKVLRQELKRQLAAAPQEQTKGKSQLTALLLLIFLGGLGIHRFYLGYTGLGILYIALLLTSFLIVPAIALFILLIIDLIRTIIGTLKPKNGEYAKKLKG